MNNSIKPIWAVLAVVVIVAGIKFLWPDAEEPLVEELEAQQPATTVEPTNIAEPEKVQAEPPVTQTTAAAPPERKIEAVEEEMSEEVEEQPENRNFVLCEHIISGESRDEFTGQIRLINKGTQAIYGWTVYWEYEDGSTITEAKNVALAGNNPYSGEYLADNAEIAPGKTVMFSFTGTKGGETGPRGVQVTGNFCM